MLPIRQIMQEMAAEKLRLSLTILAVAWSTLCIAGLLAVGEGIRSGIVRTIQNGNGNLIHVSGGYATQTHGRFHEGKRFLSPSKIAKSWPLCLWSNTHFLRPSGKS